MARLKIKREAEGDGDCVPVEIVGQVAECSVVVFVLAVGCGLVLEVERKAFDKHDGITK